MRPVRVLLSARDPGAAVQVGEVARALSTDLRAAVTVVASGAAFDILGAEGNRPVAFTLPDGSDHVGPGRDPLRLLEAAGDLVKRLDPDVVVVGISSLGAGLDEALLAKAEGRPTFALQDYPGDANGIGGVLADQYFVRDDAAARLTHRRFGVTATPVGSLRHARYRHLDAPALRASGRARIGVSDHRPVIGFFGQPAEVPGQEAALAHLAAALVVRAPSPLVLLRDHPKSLDLREGHRDLLARAGLSVHDATGDGAVEPWLAACDVVATCFSSASIDHAFLSAWSPAPLGAVLFLLTSAETWAFMRECTGLEAPDGAERGLGRVAETPGQVGPLLDELLSVDGRRAYHAACRSLPREAAVDLIVTRVIEAGRARAGAAAHREP